MELCQQAMLDAGYKTSCTIKSTQQYAIKDKIQFSIFFLQKLVLHIF